MGRANFIVIRISNTYTYRNSENIEILKVWSRNWW